SLENGSEVIRTSPEDNRGRQMMTKRRLESREEDGLEAFGMPSEDNQKVAEGWPEHIGSSLEDGREVAGADWNFAEG
ncbi:unnamed protein product, partial [Ilex paraguariensis]